MLVQRLPTDSTAVVFKALQSYSDGSIVRWIDPVVAGQAAPDHPTPILTLTAPDATASPGTASTAPAATSRPGGRRVQVGQEEHSDDDRDPRHRRSRLWRPGRDPRPGLRWPANHVADTEAVA